MKISKVTKTEEGTGEITMEYAEQTFKELLAFQGYGFCFGYDAEVTEKTHGRVYLGDIHPGDMILAPSDEGDVYVTVKSVMLQGSKDLYEVILSNGNTINITSDHPIMCMDGVLRSAQEILDVYDGGFECMVQCMDGAARIDCMQYIGVLPVMDIEVDNDSHLFYANGIAVHNCKAHATSYSVYSAVQMWLQEHYFLEYMCALMSHIDRAKEKKGVGVLNERVEYCMKHGTTIYYPDVNKSTDKWEICGGGLLAPLKNIKGFSDREVNIIRENAPYKDLKDFLDRTKLNKSRFEQLLFANAFSTWGTVEDLYNWYYNHYVESEKPRKKKQDTFDLFGDAPEEESSSSSEVIRTFSKTELEEKCMDLNGFIINENIQIKYHEFFERGMKKVAEIKKDDAYDIRRRICKLDEVLKEKVEEDTYKNHWVLAKVIQITRDIAGQYGKFDKLVINDGVSKVTITGRVPMEFQKGRVMVFPISVKDNGKIYIDTSKTEQIDPFIVEEP